MSAPFSLSPVLVSFMSAIYALLIAGTAVYGLLRLTKRDKDFTELWLRIRSWWIMIALFSIAVAIGEFGVIGFFALVSLLALREYFAMVPFRKADRRAIGWAYLSIPLQYYWIASGWYGMFVVFIPVYFFLFLPIRMLVTQETKGFLHAAGTLHWGLMITVFCIGHVAYLAILPHDKNLPHDGVLLILYLVFLTQFNDVLQYVWGKLFGSHRVIPRVSPGKTWGGLIGGIATTSILATLLGPHLTPMSYLHSFFAGLIIGASGFVGDINISALKRDLGVKDSGTLIPGHGGILDRVDSICYAAPLFFHYIRYLYF